MLTQILEIVYEAGFVEDKMASQRLDLGISELLYIPFPFFFFFKPTTTNLVLFRPLITSSFCSHNPSKLPAEKSKNKNKHSCFEAYCLNNCNTPQTCGPISYLLLGFPVNQSQSSRRRYWHPTPVHLHGKSHGWRSLVGCNPSGHQELDTTE